MEFILRIIDQTGKNSEQTTDMFLGKSYTATMKVANDTEELSEDENKFAIAVQNYYANLNLTIPSFKSIDKEIVGVIVGVDTEALIYKHQAVFIVNAKGETYKRIYGQHRKY